MLKSKLCLGMLLGGLSLALSARPASAEQQWYFWVENHSSAPITKLLVSQDQSSWGYFDIGTGIASGAKTKLVWDQSTNNENCNQWIKAAFSDNSESEVAKFDFCQDLDTPIVFGN